MKIFALLISVALAAPDGGSPDADTEIDLGSHGIYFVSAALTCPSDAQTDAGICLEPKRLAEGWWLSRERMTLTGTRIVTLQNDLATEKQRRQILEQELATQPWFKAALIGFGLGVVVGAGTLIYLKH